MKDSLTSRGVLCKLAFSDYIVKPFAYVSVFIKYKLAVSVKVEKKGYQIPCDLTNSGKLSPGFWELNLGPFQEQQILFSTDLE